MDEKGKPSILRRKASDGRQEYLARSMSPGKALRLALERAAEKGLVLSLEVQGVTASKVAHEDLSGHLDAGALLAVLDGEDGEPAAASMDAQVLGALVEHQTIGKIVPRPAVGRVPTRVDAALITPFLNDTLARFVSLLQSEDTAPGWLQIYKFGAMAAGPRTLSLAMTAHDYHLFEFDISLDGGAKTGKLTFCFPECRVAAEHQPGSGDDGEKQFRQSVLMAPTTLRAVLTRISLPITQLQGLSVGDVLTISGDALRDTILETGTGEEIARVQFGQVNGLRAIRLRSMGLPRAVDAGQAGEFVEDQTIAPTEQELDDLLAAETALDALLPPVEDETAASGFDDDLSDLGDLDDLDDLIQLSAADIGDPTAMARLEQAADADVLPDSPVLGDGV